ncbi:MAG: class I adenylate-forming enzyme family protein [Gemmatimonadota bacterium]
MALGERAQDLTVRQILSRQAEGRGDADFLLSDGQVQTYRQVAEQSHALAAALADLGVESGDRVAVVLPGCPEFAVTFFALAHLGAVAVPLNPRLTEAEFRYMLRHSEAVCAITVETLHGLDYLQLFEELLPSLPELQYLVTVGEEDLWYDDRIYQFEDLVSSGKGKQVEEPRLPADDRLLAIVYTSGTTGKPKGVELTEANLVHVAAATVEAVGLLVEDRVIGMTALFHVFGLGPGLIGTALTGATLVLQDEFDPGGALDLIQRHRATVHYGVPTVFLRELREQRNRPRDLSSLRVGLVAGGPMGRESLEAVEEELCPVILTAYSMSEASSTISMTRRSDSPEKRHFTVGRPLEGTVVRVLHDDGTPLPHESLGGLAVKGPGVMRGYYRQPRETAQSFDQEGYLRTGDLGMVDEEGYVHLVGRRKDVIIRGGSNVYPREVEDRLLAHPAVLEAAVVGVPDEFLGEAIGAVVVPIEGAIVTADEVRDWCRLTLTNHKVPDLVSFHDSLPMTGTGKIRRVELARLIEAERANPES